MENYITILCGSIQKYHRIFHKNYNEHV